MLRFLQFCDSRSYVFYIYANTGATFSTFMRIQVLRFLYLWESKCYVFYTFANVGATFYMFLRLHVLRFLYFREPRGSWGPKNMILMCHIRKRRNLDNFCLYFCPILLQADPGSFLDFLTPLIFEPIDFDPMDF